MDLRIPPIEEAFYVVSKFNIPAVGDEHEEADSLRYMFQKLQDTANRMSATVVNLYPSFREQLLKDLDTFKFECDDFCVEYGEDGPMKPSLSPREASDRLLFCQVVPHTCIWLM